MEKEKLDYIQGQAEKNMDFHLKNLEGLNTDVYKLLAALVVVISASFGASVQTFAGKSWILGISMGTLTLYLIGIALVLINAVKPTDLHAPGNEPKNLFPVLKGTEWSLEVVREKEIGNLQERIVANRSRCAALGRTVRLALYAFLASPVVFVSAAVVATIIISLS